MHPVTQKPRIAESHYSGAHRNEVMPNSAPRAMQANYEYWAVHYMLLHRDGFHGGQVGRPERPFRFFNQFCLITARGIGSNKEKEEKKEGKPLDTRLGEVIKYENGKEGHRNLSEPVIAED